jgi:hypothetical protein
VETGDQYPEHPADAEGVATLVKIAEDTVEDERTRGRALDTKSATLAGFTGVILSVNGGLAATLFRQNLGPVGKPIAVVCFLGAVICLLLAVGFAVLGVLKQHSRRYCYLAWNVTLP